jgi:RsiW-degrading membrane proteinase PrsW (M82 family)
MHSKTKWLIVAPLLALGGGVLGVFGAIMQEIFYGSFFAAFVAGPMIEETMKPTGVYLLHVFKADAYRGRIHRAFLSALGGLSFSLIENLFYLMVYYPDHSSSLLLFRFTWTLGLHIVTSFIVGFGINEELFRSIRGEIPLLRGNWRYFVVPVVMHGVFNIVMVFIGKRWV